MSVHGASHVAAPRYDEQGHRYDALLLLSFGGPEGMDEVMPFLENVTRGRNIPRARLEEVAEHYYHYGGVSPINAQNRALIAALGEELAAHGIALPIYFGNRNWHPLVGDAVRQMRDEGVTRALLFATSAFGSYSGCRQYRENVLDAMEAVEGAPQFDKIRLFYNHPAFIETMVERTRHALNALSDPSDAILLFSAHSIPQAMAQRSEYERQLAEAARLVAEGLGSLPYRLLYQSRSGPPHVPWLEPDIADVLHELHAQGQPRAVIVPIGFISDHLEVLYDLDHEAAALADELGLEVQRAETVGTHPTFVGMIRELIQERLTEQPERRAQGCYPPNHDICPMDCCLPQ